MYWYGMFGTNQYGESYALQILILDRSYSPNRHVSLISLMLPNHFLCQDDSNGTKNIFWLVCSLGELPNQEQGSTSTCCHWSQIVYDFITENNLQSHSN